MALKFDRRFGSIAAERPVKFQGNMKISTPKIVVWKQYEILRQEETGSTDVIASGDGWHMLRLDHTEDMPRGKYMKTIIIINLKSLPSWQKLNKGLKIIFFVIVYIFDKIYGMKPGMKSTWNKRE